MGAGASLTGGANLGAFGALAGLGGLGGGFFLTRLAGAGSDGEGALEGPGVGSATRRSGWGGWKAGGREELVVIGVDEREGISRVGCAQELD